MTDRWVSFAWDAPAGLSHPKWDVPRGQSLVINGVLGVLVLILQLGLRPSQSGPASRWHDSFRTMPGDQAGRTSRRRAPEIGRCHRPLVEKHGCSIANQTIALFLAEKQPTLSRTTFGRLAREHLPWATCA